MLGRRPVRYGGANRFDTAVVIAGDGLGNPQTVLLATGNDFPDALGAGAAAGGGGGAVLLTADETMPPETAGYLDTFPDATLFWVGGQAARAVPAATPPPLLGYLEGNASLIDAAFLYGGVDVLAPDIEAAVESAID